MPIYTYQNASGVLFDLTMTIAEMEAYEACPGAPARVLMPPRRHVSFHEGYYEHVSETGAHVSNMSDLKRVAREAGNYSVYAEDLGGLFRAKEGRWI